MSTLTHYLSAMVLVASLSGLVCSQDMTVDFEQILAAQKDKTVRPQGALSCHDIESVVDGYVAKHKDASAITFLERKIQELASRKLALLSLAKLAVANEAAGDALYRQIYGKSTSLQRDTLIAVGYIDPTRGRVIAETVLSRPGHWRLRGSAYNK